MSWSNQYQQNNRDVNNVPFAKKIYNKKLMFILVIFSIILCVVFVVSVIGSNSYEDRAAEAARKVIPNAKAKKVVVADGFAMAIVYVPKADGQLGSGNTTVFRVNEDGSMTYIAGSSYFSPIDLLEFGIPLETQAKLRETDISNIKQELASSCDYGNDGTETPGFTGFNGSFNPDGWQIDSATQENIAQALETVVGSSNVENEYVNKIICVNAKIEDSGIDIDKATFASTFKLKLQFVTSNGVLTDHDFTFSDGPIYSRTYTLDGKQILQSEFEDFSSYGD